MLSPSLENCALLLKSSFSYRYVIFVQQKQHQELHIQKCVQCIFDLQFLQSLSLMQIKLFYLQIWRMGYKNTLFHTDFKNVNLTLVKSAPKNRFSQKTVLEKSVLGKKLFRCIFYYGQINVFKISIKSRIFYTLFDQFKGKVFISQKSQCVFSINQKVQTASSHSIFRKTVFFYKQVLHFDRPSATFQCFYVKKFCCPFNLPIVLRWWPKKGIFF